MDIEAVASCDGGWSEVLDSYWYLGSQTLDGWIDKCFELNPEKSRLTLRTFLPASGCLFSSAAGSVGMFVQFCFVFLPPLGADNTFGFNKYSKSDSYQMRCGKLSICALESVTGSEMRRGKAVIRDPTCFDLRHSFVGGACCVSVKHLLHLTDPQMSAGPKNLCAQPNSWIFFYFF